VNFAHNKVPKEDEDDYPDLKKTIVLAKGNHLSLGSAATQFCVAQTEETNI